MATFSLKNSSYYGLDFIRIAKMKVYMLKSYVWMDNNLDNSNASYVIVISTLSIKIRNDEISFRLAHVCFAARWAFTFRRYSGLLLIRMAEN